MWENIALYQLIIGIAFLFSCYYYFFKKKKSALIKDFLIFLGLASFTEIFLFYYLAITYNNNLVATNTYATFCATFYLYIYYRYLDLNKYRNPFLIVSCIWFIVEIIALLMHLDPPRTIARFYLMGLFIATAAALYFFHLVLKKNELQLFKKPLFYFSTGIILFLVTGFPHLAFYDYTNVPGINLILTHKFLQIGNIFLSLGYLSTVICLGRTN